MGYVSKGIRSLKKGAAILCASTLLAAPAGLNAKSIYTAHHGDMSTYGEPSAKPDDTYTRDDKEKAKVLDKITELWKKCKPLVNPRTGYEINGIGLNDDDIKDQVIITVVENTVMMNEGKEYSGKRVTFELKFGGKKDSSTLKAVIGGNDEVSFAKTEWFQDTLLPEYLDRMINVLK
jgi:hypothetical protein